MTVSENPPIFIKSPTFMSIAGLPLLKPLVHVILTIVSPLVCNLRILLSVIILKVFPYIQPRDPVLPTSLPLSKTSPGIGSSVP